MSVVEYFVYTSLGIEFKVSENYNPKRLSDPAIGFKKFNNSVKLCISNQSECDKYADFLRKYKDEIGKLVTNKNILLNELENYCLNFSLQSGKVRF